MSHELYAAVDRYLEGLFGPADRVLDAALARSAAAGLPPIHVSAALGRFLHVLALARGARTILEIGTLGGYSAIWLARALPPGGKLVSLEYEPSYAEIARYNIGHAGLADRVEVRVGRALDLLAQLEDDVAGPFDMVFIDADKSPYTEYFHAALRLARPGTLIVADNVVREGRVALGSTGDQDVAGIQRFNAALAADTRVAAAVVQQVGVKGHDGMAVAVVRDTGATA
ncbi:MAG: O-methyltransferase [Actinomycetota bacterium]|nr:O-methyltransferase [Actinomycetota bacterium]